jgi:hypothetical protein
VAEAYSAEEFAGRRVVDLDPALGFQDPRGVAYAVALSGPRPLLPGEEPEQPRGVLGWSRRVLGIRPQIDVAEYLPKLFTLPGAEHVEALVVGLCDDFDAAAAQLAAQRDRLPSLRALLWAGLTQEESELSWIVLGDVTPILAAFPALETLRLRGNEGLSLGAAPRHLALRCLALENVRLDADVFVELLDADLPALTELELWLGTADQGPTIVVADLMPILSGKLFPGLRRLRLCNAELADEVAEAVAVSPLLNQLVELDLSLGTLGERGFEALLASPAVSRLERLDVSGHWAGPEAVERLRGLGIPDLPAEPAGDAGTGEEPYVAVWE